MSIEGVIKATYRRFFSVHRVWFVWWCHLNACNVLMLWAVHTLHVTGKNSTQPRACWFTDVVYRPAIWPVCCGRIKTKGIKAKFTCLSCAYTAISKWWQGNYRLMWAHFLSLSGLTAYHWWSETTVCTTVTVPAPLHAPRCSAWVVSTVY